MKIALIESFILTDKLKESFFFSQWSYSERNICIVKVTSECGTTGWGEAYGPASIVNAAIKHLSSFVLGQNCTEIETIWGLMYRRTLDFSRSGVIVSAMSAIDIALWDLKGKILNLPVHNLLGGKKNPIITPYATGMYFCETSNLPEKLADEAAEYAAQGFKAMKIKVGLSITKDLKIIEAIRKSIGPDIKLMIDANHAYNYREAVKLSLAAEQYDISWFEEPLSPEYYQQFRELRQKTSIPIASGECEYLRFGHHRLLESGAVDILQPDICASGGLTEAKRISALASVYGVDIIPHSWGTGIALSAAVNFVANLDVLPGRMFPDINMIEYDRTENGLRDELTSAPFEVVNGEIKVGSLPGLGIQVNENALLKYSHNGVKATANGIIL